MSNLNGWSSVWREVKKLDVDRNGFLEMGDLEQVFRDYFPDKLIGYSFYTLFKSHESTYDRNLVNYKLLKDSINRKIQQMLYDDKEK